MDVILPSMDFASDIWQLTVLFRLNPANNWKLVLASIAILWIPGACCHLAYKLETQPSLSTRNILLNIILHPVIYPIRILVSLCNKSSEKDLEDSYLLAVRGSLVTPMQFILQSLNVFAVRFNIFIKVEQPIYIDLICVEFCLKIVRIYFLPQNCSLKCCLRV